ncbi:REP-associated tyrosine transposase [Paludisphaera borealis]|uniref:REP-associated tyrosine transposase n=1 Tax=Paludisphaera borealis TaxID=1387353 RepID=UPI00403B1F2E
MAHDDPKPRRGSYNEAGHAHELTFTCCRRYRFLSSERTCLWLSEAIEAARIRLDFSLWGFVFMPEHVHLVLWPRRPSYDISAILKAIKEPVGRQAVAHLVEFAPEWLPRITRRRGNREERLFWQSGGGYDRNIREPRVLTSMMDYVHQNPVRRGLVERAADWRWSSAGWYEDAPSCDLMPDPIPPEWAH